MNGGVMRLGGVERQALVVNAPPPGSLRPAGLVLHGGRGSAQEQRDRTGFDGLALREGFMVVYPEGTPWTRGLHAWNTGYLPRRLVGEADDIAYLGALSDLLVARNGADPQQDLGRHPRAVAEAIRRPLRRHACNMDSAGLS